MTSEKDNRKPGKIIPDLGLKRRASAISAKAKDVTSRIMHPGHSHTDDSAEKDRKLKLAREELKRGSGELSEQEKAQKRQQVTQSLSAEENHLSTLRSRLVDTQSELTTCKEIIHISNLLGITNDNVQTTILALERKQAKLKEDLPKFKSDHGATAIDAIPELSDKMESINNKVEALTNKIEDLKARRKKSLKPGRVLRRFFDRWKTTRSKTGTELRNIVEQLTTAQAQLQQYAINLAEQHLNHNELVRLQEDLKDSAAAIKTLDQNKSETFTEVRDQIKNLSTRAANTEDEIRHSEKTIAQLQSFLRGEQQDQVEQDQNTATPAQDAAAAEPEKEHPQTQDPNKISPQEINRARIKFHKSLDTLTANYTRHRASKQQIRGSSRFFDHKEENIPLSNMISGVCSYSQNFMKLLQHSANKTEDAEEYEALQSLTRFLVALQLSNGGGGVVKLNYSQSELINLIENAIKALPSSNPLHNSDHPLQKFIAGTLTLQQDNDTAAGPKSGSKP